MDNSIVIESTFKDIIPKYLDDINSKIKEISNLIEANNPNEARSIAHKIAGSAGGFGLHKISEIGSELEKALTDSELSAAKEKINDLDNYLKKLTITYS